jgi:hypothetical protein
MNLKGQFIPVPLKDGWKSEIRTQGKHFALPITIKTMDTDTTHTVAVALRDLHSFRGYSSDPPKVRMFPISGFPVVFKDLQALVSTQ